MQSKNDQWPILNDQSINSLLFGVQKERTYESLRKSFIIFVAGVGNQPNFCTPKQEKTDEKKSYQIIEYQIFLNNQPLLLVF